MKQVCGQPRRRMMVIALAAKASMVSLAEAAPEFSHSMRRNSEFYGDPNTVGGNLLERTQLTGVWGGVRGQAIAHGVYFDASVTRPRSRREFFRARDDRAAGHERRRRQMSHYSN